MYSKQSSLLASEVQFVYQQNVVSSIYVFPDESLEMCSLVHMLILFLGVLVFTCVFGRWLPFWPVTNT